MSVSKRQKREGQSLTLSLGGVLSESRAREALIDLALVVFFSLSLSLCVCGPDDQATGGRSGLPPLSSDSSLAM